MRVWLNCIHEYNARREHVGELGPENRNDAFSDFFKLKGIYHSKAAQVYHSNKIEGNRLSYNETAIMITGGAELAAKPPIDQLEARNLARALDFAFDTAPRSP